VGFGEASVFWKGVGRTIVRVSAVKLGIRGSDGEMKERREEFRAVEMTLLKRPQPATIKSIQSFQMELGR